MGKSKSLKEIEASLHPNPMMDGYAILHRHVGQYIYFTVWSGEDQASSAELRYHRDMVLLSGSDFYKHEKDNLEWLVKEAKENGISSKEN